MTGRRGAPPPAASDEAGEPSLAAALRDGQLAGLVRRERLIAVLRRIEPRSRLLELVDELADAGVRIVEVTFDSPTAEDDLAALRVHLDARDDGPFAVGAGTILRPDRLEAARRAGADFGVAPLLDPAIVESAIRHGMPFVPGAFTPSEAAAAWAAGATFVKLFPASAVGSSFVRELRGPMPWIELIPTGGVDASNARAFLDAGAVAVGVGSALSRSDATTRRALVAAVRMDGGRPT